MNIFRALRFFILVILLGVIEGKPAFEYQGKSEVMFEKALALIPYPFRNRVRNKVLKELEKSVKGGKVSERELFNAMCSSSPSPFREKTAKILNEHKSASGTWVYAEAKDL